MKHTNTAPVIMGLAMGAMMLAMIHPVVTGQSQLTLIGLAGFVAAHLVVVALALGLTFFGATRFPKVRAIVSRLHRPNPRHAAIMLTSAGASALALHLLHGAP